MLLPGDAGQVLERWDTRGGHWQTGYDERLRPLSIREAGRLAERFIYGAEEDVNRRGPLLRHDDEAGSRTVIGYSLGAEESGETRCFLESLELPDWSQAPSLEPGEGETTRHAHGPLASEKLEQIDARGNRQVFRYGLNGLLSGLTLRLAEGTEHRVQADIRYNAQLQIESRTAGNGVVSRLHYDPANGRLVRFSASRPGRSMLQDLVYAHDPRGNVLQIEDHSQPVRHFANQRVDPVCTFLYDSLCQLIEASGREAAGVVSGPDLPELAPDTSQLLNYSEFYDYDASGNLVSLRHVGQQQWTRTFEVAAHSNRALPAPADPATGFDPNGNLLELAPGQPLQWSARDRLLALRQVTRANAQDDEEQYRYGGDGLRVRKVAARLVAGRMQHGETRYLPGLELHTRQGEAFAVLQVESCRCLVWSEGQPEGIAGPQWRYGVNDLYDSSALELDGEARIITHEGYSPFGGTAWWAGRSALEAGYKTSRYSGRERDSSGLYHYGLRYYAPWLARWINPDPAGDVDGLNRYAMVRNNPVTREDRHGLVGADKQAVVAEPARRQFVSQHFTHEVEGHTVRSTYFDQNYVESRFTNTYEPDQWLMEHNYKKTDTRSFFASDVALHQLELVYGSLDRVPRPSTIVRSNVVNLEARDALAGLESESGELKRVFFDETPNGKTTRHLMQAMKLEPAAVTVDFQPGIFKPQMYITVHVANAMPEAGRLVRSGNGDGHSTQAGQQARSDSRQGADEWRDFPIAAGVRVHYRKRSETWL